MMNRTLLIAPIVVITLASSIALGTLYRWNESKRPPVSLEDALVKAEKLLGDDAANYYCVSVSLFGDATGGGTEGAWNLFYAAADGSKKHVYIDMRGESDVKHWNGAIDRKLNEGRRNSLADVQRRLKALFTKEGIKAEFDVEQGSLLVKYNVRDFQVYPRLKDGGYAKELHTMPGPDADGIWLQVRIVDKPDWRYGYRHSPYWTGTLGTYFTTTPGEYLSVEFRCGHNVKYEVRNQIWDVFGEAAPPG